MNTLIVNDYAELSASAAGIIAAIASAKPNAAIIPATGNSPIGAYRELAKMHAAGQFDAAQLRIFQLDSYLGITPEDPRSLYGWMDRELLSPLRIPPTNVIRLFGDADRVDQTITAYQTAVDASDGIDLAILGLGPNGHLGFNEPPSDPSSPTRRVTLTEASIQSNAAYWGGRDRVPTEALTCGLDVLLGARHILLLVSGAHKCDILARTLAGPPTPDIPASYLTLAQNVTVIADREAWGHV